MKDVQQPGRYSGGRIRERGDSVFQHHDRGYRSLLASKKVFVEFLRGFAGSGRVDELDERELIRVDKSYISADYRKAESDIVYRGKTAAGRDIYYYVLIALRPDADPLLPFRLLGYMIEVWRDTLKNAGFAAESPDFRFPAVVPIVVYNGKRPWTAPHTLKGRRDGTALFGEGTIDFAYTLVDVWRLDEQELMRMDNLVGAVFWLDRAENAKDVLARLSQAIGTVNRLPQLEQALFWRWTSRILGSRMPEDARKELEAAVQSGFGEAEHMITNIERAILRSLQEERLAGKKEGWEEGWADGREEGREEGALAARRKAALKLMDMGMGFEQIAEAVGVPAEEILRWQLH